MAGNEGGGHGATTGVWIAVAAIVIGSVVAGIALIVWNWPLFWVGSGLMVAGSIGAYFVDIMDMVSEFAMTTPSAEVESS